MMREKLIQSSSPDFSTTSFSRTSNALNFATNKGTKEKGYCIILSVPEPLSVKIPMQIQFQILLSPIKISGMKFNLIPAYKPEPLQRLSSELLAWLYDVKKEKHRIYLIYKMSSLFSWESYFEMHKRREAWLN